MSTSFLNQIDILSKFSNGQNAATLSKINFASMVGSTALMCYLYRMSTQPTQTEAVWGGKDAYRKSRYLKYAAFACGTMAAFSFIMYPKHKLQEVEDKLNVPSKLPLSEGWRKTIALCIAIPALIVEVAAWNEVGTAPLDPEKQEFVGYKELFGGIYNYMRHPIWFCEFSWFYTLSFLFDSPFLMLVSAGMMTPACYHMCSSDEMQLVRQFGHEYHEYQKKTGFWFPTFHH